MTRRPFLFSSAVVLALGFAGAARAADTPIDVNQLATQLNNAIAAAPTNRAIKVDPLDAGAAQGNGAAPAQAGVDPLAAAGQGAPNLGGNAGGQVVPGAEVAPGANAGNGPIGNGVGGPPIQGLAPPGGNQQGGPPTVITAGKQVADGGDLYNRIAQQGYRPIHLVDSNAAIFVVLAGDQAKANVYYLLTVDIAYGEVRSVRPIDVAALGNYGVSPQSPYGNPYAAPGYAAPPAYAAPPTYAAPAPGYYGTPPPGYGTPAPNGYGAPPNYGGQRY